MERKEISQAVIGRLPRYYRYLSELRDEGVERISAGNFEGQLGEHKTYLLDILKE